MTFEEGVSHRQIVEDVLSRLNHILIPRENLYNVGDDTFFTINVITSQGERKILRYLNIELHKILRSDLEMLLHKCGATYKVLKVLYKNDLVYLAEHCIKTSQ